MDPMAALARQYVNNHRGVAHSALPDAPQLPASTAAVAGRVAAGVVESTRAAAIPPGRVRGRPSIAAHAGTLGPQWRKASDTGRVMWRG